MTSQRKYPNAPITEAIMDLRVKPSASVSLQLLEKLSNDSSEDYPNTRPIIETKGSMLVQPGVSATASTAQKQTGFRSISHDQKYICQRQLEGFTFSRLAPYENWEPFRERARTHWTAYRNAVSPRNITRLAVRYINRIDIPVESPKKPLELKEYFRTCPEVSPDLPQTMEGFFMQVQLPQEDIVGQVIINQTIVPPTEAGFLSVILDLDLFRNESVPDDEAEIWECFETLRIRKDELFEACITDSTRELFD